MTIQFIKYNFIIWKSKLLFFQSIDARYQPHNLVAQCHWGVYYTVYYLENKINKHITCFDLLFFCSNTAVWNQYDSVLNEYVKHENKTMNKYYKSVYEHRYYHYYFCKMKSNFGRRRNNEILRDAKKTLTLVFG